MAYRGSSSYVGSALMPADRYGVRPTGPGQQALANRNRMAGILNNPATALGLGLLGRRPPRRPRGLHPVSSGPLQPPPMTPLPSGLPYPGPLPFIPTSGGLLPNELLPEFLLAARRGVYGGPPMLPGPYQIDRRRAPRMTPYTYF